MGKAGKKKPNADFTKTKAKVGRKLQPQAATDTSYAAKTVGLPTQSITLDKSSKPVTKRNHTLEDLLVMMGHTSKGTRKDALVELEELLTTFPQLITNSVSQIVQASVQRITDDDSPVRKALLSFLRFYLDRVPQTLLEPFQHTLMLHLHSALSNIFEPIRFDALKVLDLFLDAFPSVVATGTFDASGSNSYGHATLLCLAPLLQIEMIGLSTSASMTPSNQIPLPQRALLLSTFEKFISASLSQQEEAQDDWFYASSFDQLQDVRQFLQACAGQQASWMQQGAVLKPSGASKVASSQALFQDATASLRYVGDAAAEILQQSEQSKPTEITPLSLYLRTAQQLLNAFLEVAQNCFIANSASSQVFDASLDIIHKSLRIQCRLVRACLPEMQSKPKAAEEAAQKLQQFLTRAAMYFPFEKHSHLQSRSQTILNTFRSASASFAELVPLLSLSIAAAAASSSPRNKSILRMRESAESLLRSVSTYLQGVLAQDDDFGQNISASALEALLPTIWLIIDGAALKREDREAIIGALLASATNSSNQNLRFRSRLFDFLAKLCLIRDAQGYHGQAGLFDESSSEDMKSRFSQWAVSLTKLLWEAGRDKHPVTKRILLFLYTLEISHRQIFEKTPGFIKGFCPFFAVVVLKPTRKVIAGPFGQMSPDVQTLARQTALSFIENESRPEEAKKLKETLSAV